jgi:hypothetical protein
MTLPSTQNWEKLIQTLEISCERKENFLMTPSPSPAQLSGLKEKSLAE